MQVLLQFIAKVKDMGCRGSWKTAFLPVELHMHCHHLTQSMLESVVKMIFFLVSENLVKEKGVKERYLQTVFSR